jgi:hypothetical protein
VLIKAESAGVVTRRAGLGQCIEDAFRAVWIKGEPLLPFIFLVIIGSSVAGLCFSCSCRKFEVKFRWIRTFLLNEEPSKDVIDAFSLGGDGEVAFPASAVDFALIAML